MMSLLAGVKKCQCTTNEPVLSRFDFNQKCLKRDNNKCVICSANINLAVHHIIERRVFPSCNGYHKSNGVSVCEPCHLLAEMTVVSCEELRQAAGIEEVILPEHYYHDHTYTKWGDVILEDGRRTPGPYFYDESVQKILKKGGVLDKYVHYYKYPRSY